LKARLLDARFPETSEDALADAKQRLRRRFLAKWPAATAEEVATEAIGQILILPTSIPALELARQRLRARLYAKHPTELLYSTASESAMPSTLHTQSMFGLKSTNNGKRGTALQRHPLPRAVQLQRTSQ